MYSNIYFFLFPFCRRNDEMTIVFPPTSDCNLVRQSTNTSTRAKKSVMKALKMSVIHVLAFVVSWTPYTVMATW